MAKTTAELRAMINERENAFSDELKKAGKLTARARMDVIFDAGTFVEVGAFVGGDGEDEFCPVITGYGSVGGLLVFAFSQDYSRLHGAMGKEHAKKIGKIIDMAFDAHAPLIGVFDSAGALVEEGTDALASTGMLMKKLAACKNIIPTVAVVSGACGGAGAVLASMFDVIVTAEKTGSLYVVPSSMLTDKTLGKPAKLAETGVSAITVADDEEACRTAALLCDYFSGEFASEDDAGRAFDASLLSGEEYDIHPVIENLFDAGSFTELYAQRAPQMTVGLAAINSRVCGVIANNPSFKGGKLCPGAAEKAVKVLSLCETLHLPVITLVDGVGVGTTDRIEVNGAPEKFAKLASAYAMCCAPKVTAVLGRAYGSAFTLMGSKSVGADVEIALDRAKIAALNPESAVEFLGEVYDESKVKEIASDWAEKSATPLEAAKKGHIDDIIDAGELRARIAAALEMLG